MADEVEVQEKTIAEIVNKTIKTVIDLSVADVSAREICTKGDDSQITEGTGKFYKKEKYLKKGIAFPTCVSVNNCVCNFSPTKNDSDCILKEGDVVKIDLGAHIDGFIAVAAHTVVVGASSGNKASGKKADVTLAAYWAVQAPLRIIKDGANNYAITEAVYQVAESYKCNNFA